jgi:hypothetical protein
VRKACPQISVMGTRDKQEQASGVTGWDFLIGGVVLIQDRIS